MTSPGRWPFRTAIVFSHGLSNVGIANTVGFPSGPLYAFHVLGNEETVERLDGNVHSLDLIVTSDDLHRLERAAHT